MIDVVFNKVFTDIFPYLAPLIFIVSIFSVTDRIVDLVRNSLNGGKSKARRTG